MASKYGFATVQEREDERKRGEAADDMLREKRRGISDATAERIGPIIRECLAEFFRSLGLSTVDYTGEDQPALFKEDYGIQGHTWKASSWKKTGTHSDYRTDGVHLLAEHTAYTITVSMAITNDGLPLLRIGDYAASKLVGGTPVAASNFALEIPSQLERALEAKTGIKPVGLAEYSAALVN
jgi:hypothetical protein